MSDPFRQFVPRSQAQLAADYRNDSDGPFTSRDQLVAAMADSRYAHDPAYRAKVEARMAKSAGADLGYEARFHDHMPDFVSTRTLAIGGAPYEDDSGTPRW